ncbi:MAG: glycosyltransferase family 1 protein [Candidatus Levybacteria bacterium]|nr:glycosyltransferase family 1 protein [Candidatus Levybacteria bacterium]
MRIGIDCRLWNETGVGRYTRNLIKNLRAIDNKNDYVLFANGSDVENIKGQISPLRPFDFAQGFEGQAKIKNNKEWKVVKADVRWHSIDEQIKFPSILNKENLDLVHFPYFSVPVFYNKPFVVTIHDLIIHNFPTGKASTLPLPIYKVKLLGYRYIVSKIAKKAEKIIVPTNSVKEEVMKKLKVPKEKIEVTYEGIDGNINSKFQPKADRPLDDKIQNYFLYVGNAYPHKNLQRLINAFIDLKRNQEYKDINLLLVGRDDYFYRKLERKLVKEDPIKILHNVNDNELSYFYKNAIALIIPSLMEGFGLTALEAMSNRCLVLASDIPALREVCQNTALYFNPLDTREIKEKMRNACDSLNHKSKYIKEGFERSKMFSWQKMTEETIKVYESCASLR